MNTQIKNLLKRFEKEKQARESAKNLRRWAKREVAKLRFERAEKEAGNNFMVIE